MHRGRKEPKTHGTNKKIIKNIIKDVRNLFRVLKENKTIK